MNRVTESQTRAFGEYAAARAYLNKETATQDRICWRKSENLTFGFENASDIARLSVEPAIAINTAESTTLKKARENLVIKQLLPCGVIDPHVLDAFLQVPRDQFIPGFEGSTIAYADASFPLDMGRVCMEPRVLGLLLQEAKITKEKDVLVIGCGSGYEAAVISKLARHVTAIECKEELVQKAERTLVRLGISNVHVVKVDHLIDRFWPHFSPYDVMLINGAIEGEPPIHFASLLKQGGAMREGGVLVTVKRKNDYLGEGMRYINIRGRLYGRELGYAQVGALPEFTQPKGFEF